MITYTRFIFLSSFDASNCVLNSKANPFFIFEASPSIQKRFDGFFDFLDAFLPRLGIKIITRDKV